MTELTDKEKAHAALDKRASGTPLTDAERDELYDDIYWYIRSLEDEVRMLG
jgi:hypothetical protein